MRSRNYLHINAAGDVEPYARDWRPVADGLWDSGRKGV